ncbi:unnamed protein product [Prunus armeniaca]
MDRTSGACPSLTIYAFNFYMLPLPACFRDLVTSKALTAKFWALRPWWRFSSDKLEAIVASIAFNIKSVEDHLVTEVESRRSR